MMKKLLKWFGIIFAVILGIGVIAVALETPEQKAKREAQAAEEKAQREAEYAAQIDDKEEVQPVNLGMKPQELGSGIDNIIKEISGVDPQLRSVSTNDNIYSVNLGEDIIWYGDLDKTGNIITSMYNVKISDNVEDRMMALLAFAIAKARTLSPDLPKEQVANSVAEVMSRAMKKFNQSLKPTTETQVIGDYKYIVNIYPDSKSMRFSVVHKDH